MDHDTPRLAIGRDSCRDSTCAGLNVCHIGFMPYKGSRTVRNKSNVAREGSYNLV